jgi:hypothetical protein
MAKRIIPNGYRRISVDITEADYERLRLHVERTAGKIKPSTCMISVVAYAIHRYLDWLDKVYK